MATIDQIIAEQCRRNFGRFVDTISPRLTRAPFHSMLDSELTTWIINGGFLVVIAPPRHGKSERVSRHLPPALYARDPTCQVIQASYAADLANRLSRDARNIVNRPRYQQLFPRTLIGPGENRAAEWRLTEGGGHRAAGVLGGVTGMGAHRLIWDDPYKNRAQADSPTYRKSVWDEYRATFRTRLEPDRWGRFGVLITLTRWHHADIVGQVLDLAQHDADADQFRVVRFPATGEPDAKDKHPDDCRAFGEALWPQKYPEEALRALRANSERDWLSLFQGRPTPESGDIFKGFWLRYWFTPAEGYAPQPVVAVDADNCDHACAQEPFPARMIANTTVSVDATFKETVGSDFVGIGVWKRTRDDRHYRVDGINKRMDFPETKAAIRSLIAQYNPGKVLIEDAANGPAIISDLRLEFGEGRIVARPTQGGKVARANAVSPYFERGKVYIHHPEQAAWARSYVDQLIAFPSGSYDDMVDETTHYLAWAQETFGGNRWLELLSR